MPSAQQLDDYSRPSALTDLGPHAQTARDLPGELSDLVRTIQGLFIYDVVAADFYGVRLSAEQLQSIHLRGARSMIDAVMAIDPSPLQRPRPPAKRLPGRCDHYTRLLTAMLRVRGVPARARCGFADYFRPGYLEVRISAHRGRHFRLNADAVSG